MRIPKTGENQCMIMPKERIDTGQGNKSRSITAIDLTGSLTSMYINIEILFGFSQRDIETKRFDYVQANRRIIQSNRQSSFQSMLGETALKVASKSSNTITPEVLVKDIANTRPVTIIVGPYIGQDKEYKNIGRTFDLICLEIK